MYYNTDGTTETKHIYAGTALVATVEYENSTSTLYYIHTDHLGGSGVMTDGTGTIVGEHDYYPFGDLRISEQYDGYDEQRKFTGLEHDEDTDLNYAGARYYPAPYGRWLSQDPASLNLGSKKFYRIVDSSYNGDKSKEKIILERYLSDPQVLNSYSYTRNNPLNRIDPSGTLDKHTKGATEEQIQAFDNALAQLQQDVANNPEIQEYYSKFGIDINEALKDNGKGVDVYIGRENKSSYQSKGNYDRLWNDIDIFSNAFTDQDNIQHTLMHELGHWANDVGKWWGDLNPDVSSFSIIDTKLNEHEQSDYSFSVWKTLDGIYGFGSEILTFGDIR